MSTSTAKVDEWMEQEFEDWYQREIDGGLPEGEDRAAAMLRCDYLLEQIADQERRAEEIAQFTARKIQMVTDHSRGELDTIKRRIEWLHGRLRLHLPGNGEGMEREFGKKSVSLPHGSIGYRAKPATLQITDMAKAVAWARGAGVEVKVDVIERVYVADLTAAYQRTGEVPEGTEYVDSAENFFVKPKGT